MLGIYIGKNKTFNVESTIEDCINFIEGSLYIDKDDRLYVYSDNEKRSSIKYEFFPIYDGKYKYINNNSNEKYFSKDAIVYDLENIINNIDDNKRKSIYSLQRNCTDNESLNPIITDSDNAFTQCIKSIISLKEYTLVQLSEKSHLSEAVIKGYYNVLNKIAFMRLDRFMIWIKTILKMSFKFVIKDNNDNIILTYDNDTEKYEYGILSYEDIINSKNDFMKKIIFIIMRMKSLNKSDLYNENTKEYTVNNLLILLNSDKPFSIQLFSRFIKLINYSYDIEVYEDGKSIFVYTE